MSKIITIVGPMGSGKSEALLRSIKSIEKDKILAFKPDIDFRNGNCIKSRTGDFIDAIAIASPREIVRYISEDTRIVVVDEVHMLDEDLYSVVLDIANTFDNIDIYCCGLNMGFNGTPFTTTAKLMAISNTVSILTSKCEICGSPAQHTRIRPGRARTSNVGDLDVYQVVCRKHMFSNIPIVEAKS